MPFYAQPSVVEGPPPDPDPDPGFSMTLDSTSTLVTGGSPQDWHGRASIKRRNDGVLVMCYRDGSKHEVNDGALHIKFSDDNGVTWTAADTKLGGGAVSGFPMNPATLSAGQDAGEPWLYHLDDDTLILHMWRIDYFVSQGGTWQSESTDGGETWTAAHGPIVFADPTATTGTHNRTFATDDDFVDPDTGDLYALARIYTGLAQTSSNFILVRTTDGGSSWERVGAGTNPRVATSSEAGGHGIQEGGMEYLGSGKIIVMLRDCDFTHSYQRVSLDMGETWGALTDVTTAVGITGRQRVYTAAHLRGEASWWTDTSLLMVGFNHQTPGSSLGRRIAVWASLDSGDTWTPAFYLNTTHDDGGYGDIFYDSDADQYVVVSYEGTLAAADLKQYRLTITGL